MCFTFVFPPFGVFECSFLDRLVPASFNLFPMSCICFVLSCVLSCTVFVGVGVRFPQSVSVLVYCPVFV